MLKQYWKMLKHIGVTKTKCNLSASNFTEYYDPGSVFFQADEDILLFNQRYLNVELQVMFEELNAEISRSESTKSCKQ